MWSDGHFAGAASVVVELADADIRSTGTHFIDGHMQKTNVVRKARIHAIKTLSCELHQEKERRGKRAPRKGKGKGDELTDAIDGINELVKSKYKDLFCGMNIAQFYETTEDDIHSSTILKHSTGYSTCSSIRTRFNMLKQMMECEPDVVEIRTAYPTLCFSIGDQPR